jgi:hypothetical protein
MSRKKVRLLVGMVAVALLLVLGCSLQLKSDSGRPGVNGWYIQLNVGAPTAKAITVKEFDVTGLEIQVLDPDGETLQTVSWDAPEGPQSYLIPVTRTGQHRIVVTHLGERDGEAVQAIESATFAVAAMVITVIDIVPGSIGVIDIEPGGSEPPEPIDLTGWWDFFITPDGMSELGPMVFCIHQEGSSLDCSLGFTGTITGYDVYLEAWLEGTHAELYATVSGDTISGTFDESPFGSGSFRLVPTTVTFSHLEMQGYVQGTNVDLDTDFAVGSFDGTDYSYRHTFQVGVGSAWGHFFFLSRELEAGNDYAVTDEDWDDESTISLQLWDGADYWTAVSGTMRIDTYDDTGMSGSFTDIWFPDVPEGGLLSGTFDVQFFANTGQVSVTGNWAGSSVDVDLSDASSDRGVQSNTGFSAHYDDCTLEAGVFLGFEGEGPPTLPWTTGSWPTVRYAFDNGTGFFDLMPESGSMTLDSYGESGASGSFVANFPGGESITGSFDLIFVEGYGIEPPGGE